MKFLFRYFTPTITIKMSYSIPYRILPGSSQESVWDYPRPPRVEDTSKHIEVIFNDVVIADTRHAKRVLETSHPPTYYLPPEDVRLKEFFKPVSNGKSSYCEWKGVANYYTIEVNGKKVENAAWTILWWMDY
ncbi:unnamed protein product [Rotaria sp. Silwood1]|nr:unnamed protein product [Rotaria sp. Silwood1]